MTANHHPHLKRPPPLMEELDRLGWAAGLAVVSHGVRFGIRTNDPTALERVLPYLPSLSQPAHSTAVEQLYSVVIGGPGATPSIRRFHLAYAGHVQIGRSHEEEPVLDALGSHMQLYVAESARRRLFVHAGVVGWKGRAIVMPALSFRGKTTLVCEFVRAGASYYSDEYAVFDQRGRIHPYPRALSIRDSTKPFDRAKRYPVEALGGQAGRKPLPLGLVIASEYRPSGKWKPRTLSAGQGALALVANTVAARHKAEVMLSTFAQALEHATIVKSVRGEAETVVQSVLESFPTALA